MKTLVRFFLEAQGQNTSHLRGKCGVNPVTVKHDISNGQLYLWHLSEPLIITTTCLKWLAELFLINRKCPMRSRRDKLLLKVAVNLQRRTQHAICTLCTDVAFKCNDPTYVHANSASWDSRCQCCCSTHSTSDREMRLLHSALAVTGEAVVACSYSLAGGRQVCVAGPVMDWQKAAEESGR